GLRRCRAHSSFKACGRGPRGIRTVATAPARSWRLRSETRRPRLGCESLYGAIWQCDTAAEIRGRPETPDTRALDGNDVSVARARSNRCWHRNVFSLSRAIDAGRAGKKHRGASI